jgi:PAS domain S-box-containing protein
MIADYVVDLRRGIDSGELVPYFQPLVELRTGQLSGFEVLARWKHPLRGMVPPDEFIQVAEDSGCIGQLMEKVLLEAFTAMRFVPEHLGLSINVSPIQLRDRTLQRQVSLAAEKAEFSLSRLTVEITESALVGNIEHARSVTEELKAQGTRIAIDDFGTGYSSLRHLHALPFDEIKVDQTFVQTMLSRRESRKIVAAIVGLGQSLGLVTVAEGVEDEAQADMLQWLGCDLGQGWLYGRPVSSGKLVQFIAEQRLQERREAGKPNPEDTAFHMDALPSQRLSQLQAIYDGAPVGLCFVGRNLRYVSLNKRLAELNNAPIVAHLGRTVAEMIPQFYVHLEPYLKRALAGEAFAGLEFQAEGPGGVVQVRSTSYQPTRDEAGEIVGISVAVLDITERESTQVALQESEDHHRYAVELNPHVPWTADAEGMIVEASPQWTKLTGMTEQEALGWGWAKALHPDDLEATAVAWKRSVETGDPADFEYRVRCRDGSWRWMRARAAARKCLDGRVIRWYGALEDIDEHKRALDELSKSRALLQGVFHAVPVGIVIAEAPSGRVVMGNPQAEAILRHPILPTANVAAHEQWVAFDANGRRLQVEEYPLVRAIQQGEITGSEELQYQRGDGSVGWVSLSAAPVRGEDGVITGGVVAIRDLGERERGRLRTGKATEAKKGKVRGKDVVGKGEGWTPGGR